MEKISIKWVEGDKFVSDKETLPPDELPPKSLMLFAAAECAGQTAVALIEKSHAQFESMEIEVSAQLSSTAAPSQNIFTAIAFRFDITCGNHHDHALVSRALELTHDKYCGITRMLKMIAPVSYGIYIHTANPEEEKALV